MMLEHVLVLSAYLFSIGIYGLKQNLLFLIERNKRNVSF